eukprot:TRINITY_DN743_c1_g5_i1.p1 TRINITY_DN743_c1_g5~~TRINITY_DN743_c1_g5_i1.p1  ORF type:complete len:146 (+),score=23.02 TRINITY_DN743_c1_g5_i1:54-491(+)
MICMKTAQKEAFLKKHAGKDVTDLPEWAWAVIVREEQKRKAKELQDTVGTMDATCSVCRAFHPEEAVERLQRVHRDIAKEFAAPLQVNSVNLEHNGKQHRHIFGIKNDYLPFTLCALATDYVRTKPRMSKNTRVHLCPPNAGAVS